MSAKKTFFSVLKRKSWQFFKGESNTQSVCGFSYLQPLAVVWDIGNVKDWFVGFYLDGNGDETIRVDHMAKKGNACKDKWIRPRQEDIQDVVEQQILPCNVVGEWDMSTRSDVFIVQNAAEIQESFDELF